MAKLMLVEDDNNLREIYEARLQAEGYDIVSARDGEDALVVAKAEKPDLIISDVMMPKISGFEMLDILRNTEELKHVKIIMLTALGQSDDQQRADRLGADRYLVKSQVTLEDIVKVAHELLQDSDGAPAQDQPAVATTDDDATEAVNTTPAEPTAVTPAAPPASEPASAPPINTALSASPATPLPVDSTPTVPTASDTPHQSAAHEEAHLEARIEEFVAGATTDPSHTGPNPPAPAPPSMPLASTPISTPTPSQSPTDDTPAPVSAPEPTADAPASDQPAASVAMESEPAPVSSPSPPPQPATPSVPAAPSPAEPAADTSESEVVVIKPDPVTAVPPEKTPVLPPPSTAPVKPSAVTVPKKKVIEPLAATPQKDIHTLLALEEVAAKNQPAPAQPAPQTVVRTKNPGAMDNQGSAATAPASNAQVMPASSASTPTIEKQGDVHIDPNSIAL